MSGIIPDENDKLKICLPQRLKSGSAAQVYNNVYIIDMQFG
jgi:hypothetical protein